MAKRLRVIIQDAECREIRRLARSRGMSISKWVRQAPGLARRPESTGDIGKKLVVIRTALRHNYLSGDIDAMLSEIEGK
jgi:hypothetical protein